MADQLKYLGPASPQMIKNQYFAPPGLKIINGGVYEEVQGGLLGAIDNSSSAILKVVETVANAVSGGVAGQVINAVQAVATNSSNAIQAIGQAADAVAVSAGVPQATAAPLTIAGEDLAEGNLSGAAGAATIGIANAVGLSGSTLGGVVNSALGALATAAGLSDDSTSGVISSISNLLGASFAPLTELEKQMEKQGLISEKAVKDTIAGNSQ